MAMLPRPSLLQKNKLVLKRRFHQCTQWRPELALRHGSEWRRPALVRVKHRRVETLQPAKDESEDVWRKMTRWMMVLVRLSLRSVRGEWLLLRVVGHEGQGNLKGESENCKAVSADVRVTALRCDPMYPDSGHGFVFLQSSSLVAIPCITRTVGVIGPILVGSIISLLYRFDVISSNDLCTCRASIGCCIVEDCTAGLTYIFGPSGCHFHAECAVHQIHNTLLHPDMPV